MDIHINLLPEKPKKNYFLFFLLGIVFGLLIVLGALGVVYYQSIQQEYDSIQDRIEMTVQLQEIYSRQSADVGAFTKLNTTVDSLLANRISSTYVLKELVKKLPVNSTFSDYRYNEAGNVSIYAEFLTKREVASYLHYLKKMDMIKEVMLNNVSEMTSGEDENEQTVYGASFSITLNMKALKGNEQGKESATEEKGEEE